MSAIPTYALYGEDKFSLDPVHSERILDRAGPHGWTISPHRHPQLHQLFLIETAGTLLQLDGQDHKLASNTVINLPSGVVHGFRFAPGALGQVITLATGAFQAVLAPASDLYHPLAQPHFTLCPAELIALFARLQQEHEGGDSGRRFYLTALTQQILCEVARMIPTADTPRMAPRSTQILEAFAELVSQRFRQRPPVADYAAALGISPTHLSRVVRRATGSGAQAYQDRATLREACRLLAYTSLDIQQIGYDLGFDDPTYFSRLFRKHVGLSPTAYRAELNPQ